jgi:hypothetical protein
MRRNKIPPYTGKSLSDLPTEVLINIFLQVHSIKEIENLGLTCAKFYQILHDFGYTSLCRIQTQLWTIQTNLYYPSLKSQGLCRRLTAIADSIWSTNLISRSVCDAIAGSRRETIVRKGCREWTKREDILIYHVRTIKTQADAKAIAYWIRDLDLRPLSRRATEVLMLEAVNLAHNHEPYAAHALLYTLRRELDIAGEQYDLSDAASSITTCLPPRMAGRLIWRWGETWTSRDNTGLF